jgi:hypothetical protein
MSFRLLLAYIPCLLDFSALINDVFYRSGDIDDSPVESSPIYQKFRSISYRLRELLNMLTVGMVVMMMMMMMVVVVMMMMMMIIMMMIMMMMILAVVMIMIAIVMMMMMTLITIFSR